MQLLPKLLDIKFDRKKRQKIIYSFFRFKIYMINAAFQNELKLLDNQGSFCQGRRIGGRLNYFQVLSLHSFLKQKRQSFKSVTAFIGINSIQYLSMILSENTSLSRIIRKFLIFFNFIIFCFKPRFPLDSKLGYLSIIIVRQFSGFNCLCFRCHISSNILKYRHIVKYRSTEISKVFIIIAKYHQSS